MTIKYTVAKPFKFNGKVLRPGDDFPGGGNYDDLLIANRMVLAVEESDTPKATRRRKSTRSKAS